MIRWLAAGIAAGAVALPAAAGPTTLFTLHDSRVREASGIARGITSPGVFYVQNDSGDQARFFALDAGSGRVRAVYSVPQADNDDWEDLAVAPDAAGVPSVWLADIGDNDGVRSSVQLYRVDEPRVDRAHYNATARTRAPDVWRLRYPSGPMNAESLAVTPHGQAFVITKAEDGHSVVYAVPAAPDPNRVQTMRRVGAITFHARASLVPSSLQVLATGAAFSPDGGYLAVRTYTDAYVWTVRGDDVAAALRTTPRRIALPLQPQGEGICFDGGALAIDSEHVGSAVYRVPLMTSGASPGLSTEGASSARPSPAPSAAPSATHPSGSSHAGLLVSGVAVLVAAGLVVVLAMRRRTSRE